MIQAFGKTALLQKFSLLRFQLSIKQIACHCDQGRHRIGGSLHSARLFPFGRVGEQPVQIFHCFQANGRDFSAARIVIRPDRKRMLTQEILVIQQQLFQAGTSHIGQFELTFPTGPGCDRSFRDILNSAARRLNHLVKRPAATIDVTLAKAERRIVNQSRLNERFQAAISAMFRNQQLIQFLFVLFVFFVLFSIVYRAVKPQVVVRNFAASSGQRCASG